MLGQAENLSPEPSVRNNGLPLQSSELQNTALCAVQRLQTPSQLGQVLTPRTLTPVRPSVRSLPPIMAARPNSRYRMLAPAPIRRPSPSDGPYQTTFYDLPPELRLEVYKLILENTIIHILPAESDDERRKPHALMRASKVVRNEALPIIYTTCSITANVTDFNFTGMLAWMQRVPPHQEHYLARNSDLKICLSTSGPTSSNKGAHFCRNLRQWLHLRSDKHRKQPQWKYSGPQLPRPVANDLKRRVGRMTEQGKRQELKKMLEAVGVQVPEPR